MAPPTDPGSQSSRRHGAQARVRGGHETRAHRPGHDPTTVPEHYPWPQAEPAAVLLESGIRELEPGADEERVDELLRTEGAAPLAERTLVVAVGSNRSPAVIRRKYRHAGLAGPIATPFQPCTVGELAVGHSAHVARRGYIAAAPHRAPGAVTELVASWFDPAQLEVIDETEPNYERLELLGAQFPLDLADGTRPETFSVYASAVGMIAEDPKGGVGAGSPALFRTRQQDLFGLLGVLTGAEAFAGDAAAVCARLAWDPTGVGELLREHALVVPDALPRPAESR